MNMVQYRKIETTNNKLWFFLTMQQEYVRLKEDKKRKEDKIITHNVSYALLKFPWVLCASVNID